MERVARYFLGAFEKGIRGLFIRGIVVYQKLVSPFLGNRCRFYPNCSEYALETLRSSTVPVYLGLFFIIRRLLRCQPYCSGGIDPPPN